MLVSELGQAPVLALVSQLGQAPVLALVSQLGQAPVLALVSQLGQAPVLVSELGQAVVQFPYQRPLSGNRQYSGPCKTLGRPNRSIHQTM